MTLEATTDTDQRSSPGLDLLQRTRRVTAVATVLLGLQLYGNLYEEMVTNVRAIAHPTAGALVPELAPGSPLYFYLPWVPIGLILVVVLAVRLPALGAPAWITRRVRSAVAALAVAVAAKALLITTINPRFRAPGGDLETLRQWSIIWAVGNGVAIVAVAIAIALLLTWRARLADRILSP